MIHFNIGDVVRVIEDNGAFQVGDILRVEQRDDMPFVVRLSDDKQNCIRQKRIVLHSEYQYPDRLYEIKK